MGAEAWLTGSSDRGSEAAVPSELHERLEDTQAVALEAAMALTLVQRLVSWL